MNRKQRLALFISALEQALPAHDRVSARALLAEILNGIEDAHSGAPNDPKQWMTDGRIYPPQDDFRQPSPTPGVDLFYSLGHGIWIAENGAIRIEIRRGPNKGRVELDKPGADGGFLPSPMTMRGDVNSFERLVAELESFVAAQSDVELEINEPFYADGIWEAALNASDGYAVVVEWKQHRGFGLVAGREFELFGGVHEIYATWQHTADRMIELWDARAETNADLAVPVAELRKLRGQLQKDVAEQMGITKGGLAQIEASALEGKVQVDTLGRLIAALGGRLVLSATFPDGTERKVAVGR